MSKSFPVFAIIVVAILFVGKSSLFIVPEGKQAIIVQFGKPIGKPKQNAGLYFKLPFIQEVRLLESRILNWDGRPNQIPTRDKKYIIVDTTARWQIVDPIQFIRTVGEKDRALSRLGKIIDGSTRNVISSHNLVEAVRNSNNIIDEITARKAKVADKQNPDLLIQDIVVEEITGEIAKIFVGREQLSSRIVADATEDVAKLGVKLIDVQLRRIAYEESVERKVYDRMISERQRIAEKIRSVGKGEQAKIHGKTDRDLKQIESGAYRKVQEIKGRAEAEAIKIYADAIGSGTDFYEFLRTIDTYKNGLQDDSRLILSADSKFLNLLKSGSITK